MQDVDGDADFQDTPWRVAPWMLLRIAERHSLEEFAESGTAADDTVATEMLDQGALLPAYCRHSGPKEPRNLLKAGSRTADYRPAIDSQLSERESREKRKNEKR